MDQNINHYRITNITLKNFLFYNMTNWPVPLIYVVGNYNSEGSVTNTEFRGITQSLLPLGIVAFTNRTEHLSLLKLTLANCCRCCLLVTEGLMDWPTWLPAKIGSKRNQNKERWVWSWFQRCAGQVSKTWNNKIIE